MTPPQQEVGEKCGLADSGVQVGYQAALQLVDRVFQQQFALFKALELQLVGVVGVDKVVDHIVQVAVLQRQLFQLPAQ